MLNSKIHNTNPGKGPNINFKNAITIVNCSGYTPQSVGNVMNAVEQTFKNCSNMKTSTNSDGDSFGSCDKATFGFFNGKDTKIISSPNKLYKHDCVYESIADESIFPNKRFLIVNAPTPDENDGNIKVISMPQADKAIKTGTVKKVFAEATNVKNFHLGDVLTIITDKLVSPREMDGIYDIMGHMLGRPICTHEIPVYMHTCKEALLAKYPELKEVNADGVTGNNWKSWLKKTNR